MGMFDGILSAVTSPVASIAGSLLGAAGSYLGTQSANQANTDIANAANVNAQALQEQANQFNAQQYATRYQTTVKDLQAAGLNPMLAYSQGGGSPVPAQAAQVQMAAPRQNALGNAVNSASTGIAATSALQDIELKKAQVHQIDTQSDNIQADTANKLDENPYVRDKYKMQLADIAYKNAMARYTTATSSLAEQGKGLTSDTPYYQDIKKYASSAYDAWGKLVDKSYTLTPWRK
jgi:hypothetical protein